jgi:hypothetical protein
MTAENGGFFGDTAWSSDEALPNAVSVCGSGNADSAI